MRSLIKVSTILFILLLPCDKTLYARSGDWKIDLSDVRKEVMNYINSLHVEGKPYGHYRFRPGEGSSFYATTDVAIIRTIMGEDLKKNLSEKQRKEWIEYINSYANPDGTYEGGRHVEHHRNGMAIGALGPLAGKQLFRVHFYEDFNTTEKIGPWLDKIDWANQWDASHYFWGGMHCFSFSRTCSEEWLETAFNWLDSNLDEETGWWRKGVPHADCNQPLGGGAHIWPIYEHHNRRFPCPDKVIDSILEMQLEKGYWLRFPSYLDLDALYGLAYMKKLAPGYRSKDIELAVEKYAEVVRENYHDFLADNPDTHLLLSLVGTFGLLQQLLPERFYDTERWTDIFSDIRLYQTDAVEVSE